METFFYICTYKATGSTDLKPCSLKPSTLRNTYTIHWYTICFEPTQILTQHTVHTHPLLATFDDGDDDL